MMDSNSNSFDMYSPKLEMDSESEREYSRRDIKFDSAKFKVHWNSENTMKLIETMEKECKELWDTKNPLNKDRNARQARLEFLADIFGTTSEEMSRKIHNLRTQFNNELRKIKRRQVVRSGWEYFDALSFLMRAPCTDPLETCDAVNLEVSTLLRRLNYCAIKFYLCLQFCVVLFLMTVKCQRVWILSHDCYQIVVCY